MKRTWVRAATISLLIAVLVTTGVDTALARPANARTSSARSHTPTTVGDSLSTPPGGTGFSRAAGAFHRYSWASEASVGHYSGARAHMPRHLYRYRGHHAACVYNPLWLLWSGGWAEIGVAHHCTRGVPLAVYAYLSCGGHSRFVGYRRARHGSGDVTLAIERTRSGYEWRVNGHRWKHRNVPDYCLHPTYIRSGLETYSRAARIPHQVVRRLGYKHDGHWHRWHGHDDTYRDAGLNGHWIGNDAWSYSEHAR